MVPSRWPATSSLVPGALASDANPCPLDGATSEHAPKLTSSAPPPPLAASQKKSSPRAVHAAMPEQLPCACASARVTAMLLFEPKMLKGAAPVPARRSKRRSSPPADATASAFGERASRLVTAVPTAHSSAGDPGRERRSHIRHVESSTPPDQTAIPCDDRCSAPTRPACAGQVAFGRCGCEGSMMSSDPSAAAVTKDETSGPPSGWSDSTSSGASLWSLFDDGRSTTVLSA
mmetsp:Transcript_25758/g.84779  ORF Transcript_25758/g.84779 Transcript_25758/m.84779 type:complete len:232 (+) Transcript_25758:36-731(+)